MRTIDGDALVCMRMCRMWGNSCACLVFDSERKHRACCYKFRIFEKTAMPKTPNSRPGHKPKKRRFCGNRFTSEYEVSFASSSGKKIKESGDCEVTVNQTHVYRIINFFHVFSAISDLVKCKNCEKDVEFNVKGEQGLGFKISVKCDCEPTEINSCPKIGGKAFEINRRFVFAMRLLGVGLQGLNIFCGIMDLGQGLASKTYYSCLHNAWTAAKSVCDVILGKAAKEEMEKNAEAGNEISHFTVSGDGTWSKRGFSSLFGAVTLIGKYSNEVVDLIVKSKFCKACAQWIGKEKTDEYESWYESHEEECACNHSGSAGKMEVDGIIEMFQRSEKIHNAKYAVYVGDGDTKTFKSLLDAKPYGDELAVKKSECVGHVKKRMGSRLRTGKKKTKNVGGKGEGKLTDKLIRDLTNYYGLAIIRNPNSVSEMKKEIYATFYHKCSTNDKPQHENCPPGRNSWCKWRQAEALNELHEYEHPPPLCAAVQDLLLPIYKDLSSDDLLGRCLGGNTQNNNETFNSVLWRIAPKHIFCTGKTIELAAFLSAIIFNEGWTPILRLMGIVIGPQAKAAADARDHVRFSKKRKVDCMALVSQIKRK